MSNKNIKMTTKSAANETNLSNPSSSPEFTILSSPRKNVILRTAISYGQTPLGIKRKTFLEMAKEINMSPQEFCAKILTSTEKEIFKIIERYHTKNNNPSLRMFFTNNFKHGESNDNINKSEDRTKSYSKKCHEPYQRTADNKLSNCNSEAREKYVINSFNEVCNSRKNTTLRDTPAATFSTNNKPNNFNSEARENDHEINSYSKVCNNSEINPHGNIPTAVSCILDLNTLDDNTNTNIVTNKIPHSSPSKSTSEQTTYIESNSILNTLLFDDSPTKLKTLLQEQRKKKIETTFRINKVVNKLEADSASNPLLESLLFS